MWQFGWRFWISLASTVPMFAGAVIAYQDDAFGRVGLWAAAGLSFVVAAFMAAWRGRKAPPR